MPYGKSTAKAKKYTPSAEMTAKAKQTFRLSLTRRLRQIRNAAAATAAGKKPAKKAPRSKPKLSKKKSKVKHIGEVALAAWRQQIARMLNTTTRRKKIELAEIKRTEAMAKAAESQAKAAAVNAAAAGNAEAALTEIDRGVNAAVAAVVAARDKKVADVDVKAAKEDAAAARKGAAKEVVKELRRGRSAGKAPSFNVSAAALKEAIKRGAEISREKRLAREEKKRQIQAEAEANIKRLLEEAQAQKAEILAELQAEAEAWASEPLQLSANALRAFRKKTARRKNTVAPATPAAAPRNENVNAGLLEALGRMGVKNNAVAVPRNVNADLLAAALGRMEVKNAMNRNSPPVAAAAAAPRNRNTNMNADLLAAALGRMGVKNAAAVPPTMPVKNTTLRKKSPKINANVDALLGALGRIGVKNEKPRPKKENNADILAAAMGRMGFNT